MKRLSLITNYFSSRVKFRSNILLLATMSMSASSSPVNENAKSRAKSLAPPTIANVDSHERTWKRFQELGIDTGLALEEMPRRMQAYAASHSLRPTPQQLELQEATEKMDYAVMAGAPDEANLLCLLLELLDAKLVVEVGVFRGLTTLAMAQCLQQLATKKGDNSVSSVHRRVLGLDVSEDYAQVGQAIWEKAGVRNRIDFRVGDAKQTLSFLLEELGENTVDLCFIDADKSSYDDYYEKSVQLTRPGGLIVVDNTLWGGSVCIEDAALQEGLDKALHQDPPAPDLVHRMRDIIAIKAINAKIASDSRIERTSFLTIADGVTICRKK